MREMNVGNEIENLTMTTMSQIRFKIWYVVFFIPTVVHAEASAINSVHSMILETVLDHHGSRFRDSSLEPVVTTEPANL